MGSKTQGKGSGGPQVVTANRLGDGTIVWFDKQDGWSEEVTDAAVLDGAALDRALQLGAEAERRRIVVGVYSVAVVVTGEGPVPLSRREQIRAVGPSVRLDLARRSPLPETTLAAAGE